MPIELRQYRTMIVAQMRRQIFRQTIPIEETRVAPMPTKLVKYGGKDASICAAKAIAVPPAVIALSNDASSGLTP